MKFYLIEISTGASSISGKSVYEYNNENDAVANFHSKLGAAMKSDLFETELISVMRSDGFHVVTEYYVHSATTAE